MSYITDVQIDDKTLKEIKKVIGYPIIDEEFSSILNDIDIIDYCVAPSLETYYTFFPQREELSLVVTGGSDIVEIACPENTLGLVRQQFVSQSSTVGGLGNLSQGSFYANPFYTASQVTGQGFSGGSFGTPFRYGSDTIVYQQKFYNESVEGSNKAYYVKYDENTNTLKLKSTIGGTFFIELATFTNDVSKIPLRKRQSFVKHTQALLLEHFANILKLSESELPSSLDSDAMIDKSEKFLEEVLTYWRESSTIPVLR